MGNLTLSENLPKTLASLVTAGEEPKPDHPDMSSETREACHIIHDSLARKVSPKVDKWNELWQEHDLTRFTTEAAFFQSFLV